MEVFHRAAAHQTTADNPGLLPESIVAPIVNFIEVARPIVATLGPTDLGSGAWSYARVTQHTQVGKQAGEKTELASRKMLITKTPLGADTFGGYVNVSKQDINRTSPAILDMVINDLAEQYAIETEEEAGDGPDRGRDRRPGDPGDTDRRRRRHRDLGRGRFGVRRHQRPGPHRRRRVPRQARRHRPAVPDGEPDRTPTRPGSPSATSARATGRRSPG